MNNFRFLVWGSVNAFFAEKGGKLVSQKTNYVEHKHLKQLLEIRDRKRVLKFRANM